MTHVLVLGHAGQLGLALQRALPPQWTLQTIPRAELDLANTEAIATAIAATKPQAIINASAYTAVDKAEDEIDLAFTLNRDAPRAVAQAAERLKAPFVHVSTDYVFNGEKASPYVETDPRDPIGIYGRSKAEGELAVLETSAESAIVRTSWVFSSERNNFLKTMLRLGETRDEVSVVQDQLGRPTGADELARACLALTNLLLDCDKRARGLFHFAGMGETSWAEFAEAIFEEAAQHGRKHVRVRRISTADYPTMARRPANSRLDTSKIAGLGIVPAPWREAMVAYVGKLLR